MPDHIDYHQTVIDALKMIPLEKAEEIRSWVKSAEADAPRIGLFGNDSHGVRVVWDVRVDAI